MWSLPDIKRMNARAASERGKLEDCLENRLDETGECAVCMYDSENCDGELRGELYYDIFSDDPFGIVWLCDGHRGHYGSSTEGYFYCDDCGRLMIENYTWESYEKDGVCLNCYAERIIEDADNWIVLNKENIDDFGVSDTRAAKHIFAVSGPRHDLQKIGHEVLFDSMTGETVTGFSSTRSPQEGIDELRENLRQAMREGYKRALLVMDGAYQFCVSIAVYV